MSCEFQCSPLMVDACTKVFNGEYEVPGAPDVDKPRIIDIGSHAGAFTLWADEKWPGCNIFAVEPAEEAFKQFARNLGQDIESGPLPEEAAWPLPNGGQCKVIRAAVAQRDKPYVFLRSGTNNPGESSLYDLGCQTPQGESVRLISPAYLPACDIMKLDCEGAELEILKNYSPLNKVRILALEWHRKAEVPVIIGVCHEAGLRLMGVSSDGRVLKFARPE